MSSILNNFGKENVSNKVTVSSKESTTVNNVSCDLNNLPLKIFDSNQISGGQFNINVNIKN